MINPFQVANTVTALGASIIFLVAARKMARRDRYSSALMLFWGVVMLLASLAGPLVAFTDLDAAVQTGVRVLTPFGWGALAIIAARGGLHRDR